MTKYEELRGQVAVEGANMEDVAKCPKCQYIAYANRDVVTVHCPMCKFKSCRQCNEEAHPGITCDQVESKAETNGRNKVEEAMTNAVIRRCPRLSCRKPFVKSDGCNKITCRFVHFFTIVLAPDVELLSLRCLYSIEVVAPLFVTSVEAKYPVTLPTSISARLQCVIISLVENAACMPT